MVDTYNHKKHWVSRVIESDRFVAIDNPLLASVVRFGTLPVTGFALVLLVQPDQVPSDFFVSISFAVTWLNIGPFLIWYYDQRVLPTFFFELEELLEDEDRIDQLSRKYDRLFSTRSWIPTALWTLLLVVLFFSAQGLLVDRGLFTLGGPFYFVYLFSVIWLGVFTGIGFMGVITTNLAIREISDEPLNITPYHPDGLGGLGITGYFAIRTTLTFSSGALLLPMSFIFVRIGTADVLVYLIVVLYTGAIAVSFLYPTYKINRQAQRIREDILDELRHEYEVAKKQMEHIGTVTNQLGTEDPIGAPVEEQSSADQELSNVDELVGQLELQRLREEYWDYRNVRLYPFQVDIFIKLVSSVLLPLVFLFLDLYLSRLL